MPKIFLLLMICILPTAWGICLPLDNPKMNAYKDTNTHIVFNDSDPKSCWHISRSEEFGNCQRFNISNYSKRSFVLASQDPLLRGLLNKERLLWDSYLCSHVNETYVYFKEKMPERYTSIIYYPLFYERLKTVDLLSHALKDISYLKTLAFQSPDIYLESKSMREREKENAEDYPRREKTGVLIAPENPKDYGKVYQKAKDNFIQSSPQESVDGGYSSFLMQTQKDVYASFLALVDSFTNNPQIVAAFTRGQKAWEKYVANHYRLLKSVTKGDKKYDSLVEARIFLLMMDRKNFLDSWRQYYTTYRKRSDAGWGRGSKEIEEICKSPRPRFLPRFEKLCE